MSLIMVFQFFIYFSWLIYSQEHHVKTVDYHTLDYNLCNKYASLNSSDSYVNYETIALTDTNVTCPMFENKNDDVLNYMSVLPGEHKKWIVLGTAGVMLLFHLLYHGIFKIEAIGVHDFLLGSDVKDHKVTEPSKLVKRIWVVVRIAAFLLSITAMIALCVPSTYHLLNFDKIELSHSGKNLHG